MASLLFSDLCSTRRGKELFFCFMQAKEILLSSYSDQHLCKVLSYLSVNLVPCTDPERDYFQQKLSSRFYPFALISEHNLLCLRTFLQANRGIQISIPNIDNQANLQDISTQSSLVSPHYLPLQSNQLGQVKPTFRLSEPGRSDENFSDTDPKFICKRPRTYVPTSVGVVQPSVRRRTSDNPVSPTESRSESPLFSLLQEPETSVATTTLSDPTNQLVSLAKSNVNRLSAQDIPTDSSVQQNSLESHLTPLNQPVDPDPLLPESIDGTSSIEIDSSKESTKSSKTVTLSESEMSPQLRLDLAQIRKFYSLPINHNRDGGVLQDVSIGKMLERIKGFLWFLKKVKGFEPALNYCSNPEVLEQFVEFMMKNRGIKAITCSRYVSSLINACKVPLVCSQDEQKDESLEKIRAIQRQLERLSRQEKIDSDSRNLQTDKVVYSELLELCREFRWEVSEKTGADRARSCMNLCLLLMYCAVNPGRVKEYISLRIYKDQSGDRLKGQNFIWFKEDGGIVLLENNYKTRNTYGLNTTDVSSVKYLNYYLQLYNSKMRSLLLHGNDHDFFFVAPRGNPFSHASYNNYISGLFEKYLSRRLTTVDLRKIVVDYFLSLPESGDYSLRESFATLMKHSIRAQQKYYDERPLSQKKERALDLLTSLASRSLDEDEPEIVSDEDQEGHLDCLPVPGDFVALVAANSTKNVPEVFVAKVLRLSEDKKFAYLADFAEEEPGRFKSKAGKSYKENTSSLIFPIDIVFSHSDGLYELRTPKIDLHLLTVQKKS